MTYDGDELALRRLRLGLLRHVAEDDQLTDDFIVLTADGRHRPLAYLMVRELKLHSVTQRRAAALDGFDLSVQLRRILQGASQDPVDLFQRRTFHNLLRQAQQLSHGAIDQSDAVTAHHHHAGVAGIDQRRQLRPLRLDICVLDGQRLALVIDGREQSRVVERGGDLPAQQNGQF